jgi:hypothetical protein
VDVTAQRELGSDLARRLWRTTSRWRAGSSTCSRTRSAMIHRIRRDEITTDVAARLVAEQFPQWSNLPLAPVALNGWDNTTFRLGMSC